MSSICSTQSTRSEAAPASACSRRNSARAEAIFSESARNSEQLELNPRRRLQHAGRGVTHFDLNRRVIDLEAEVEALADLHEKGIAGMAGGHDQMRGQRVLRGAHRPNMQVVHAGNAWQRLEKLTNLGRPDLIG